MRLRELALIGVIGAIACRHDKPAPPPRPEPVLVPAIPTADAGTPLVELLHAVPTVVRVSSQVQNAAIKPEHLVDHDLDTAWNSRTGELAGSWIQVTLPAGAKVDHLAMTAGHTGHGPKGEDYFTMNPRITKVSVLRGDQVLGTFKLDPSKRELQTLPVHGEDTLRIRVDGVVLGTKKTWRETCVSELEVWGTLPPGAQAQPLKPVVEVEPPPPPPSELAKACDHITQAKAEWEQKIHAEIEACADLPPDQQVGCGVDPPGEPTCDVTPADIEDQAAPWQEVAVVEDLYDSAYYLGSIDVLVRANGETITADAFELPSMQHIEVGTVAARVKNGALMIDYETKHGDGTTPHEVVCQAKPTATCRVKK